MVLNWTGDISSSLFSRNTSNTGSLLRPGPERLSFSRRNSVLRLRFAIYIRPFVRNFVFVPARSLNRWSMRCRLTNTAYLEQSWNEKRDERRGANDLEGWDLRTGRIYPLGHRRFELLVQQVALSGLPATRPSPLYSYHVNAPYRLPPIFHPSASPDERRQRGNERGYYLWKGRGGAEGREKRRRKRRRGDGGSRWEKALLCIYSNGIILGVLPPRLL